MSTRPTRNSKSIHEGKTYWDNLTNEQLISVAPSTFIKERSQPHKYSSRFSEKSIERNSTALQTAIKERWADIEIQPEKALFNLFKKDHQDWLPKFGGMAPPATFTSNFDGVQLRGMAGLGLTAIAVARGTNDNRWGSHYALYGGETRKFREKGEFNVPTEEVKRNYSDVIALQEQRISAYQTRLENAINRNRPTEEIEQHRLDLLRAIAPAERGLSVVVRMDRSSNPFDKESIDGKTMYREKMDANGKPVLKEDGTPEIEKVTLNTNYTQTNLVNFGEIKGDVTLVLTKDKGMTLAAKNVISGDQLFETRSIKDTQILLESFIQEQIEKNDYNIQHISRREFGEAVKNSINSNQNDVRSAFLVLKDGLAENNTILIPSPESYVKDEGRSKEQALIDYYVGALDAISYQHAFKEVVGVTDGEDITPKMRAEIEVRSLISTLAMAQLAHIDPSSSDTVKAHAKSVREAVSNNLSLDEFITLARDKDYLLGELYRMDNYIKKDPNTALFKTDDMSIDERFDAITPREQVSGKEIVTLMSDLGIQLNEKVLSQLSAQQVEHQNQPAAEPVFVKDQFATDTPTEEQTATLIAPTTTEANPAPQEQIDADVFNAFEQAVALTAKVDNAEQQTQPTPTEPVISDENDANNAEELDEAFQAHLQENEMFLDESEKEELAADLATSHTVAHNGVQVEPVVIENMTPVQNKVEETPVEPTVETPTATKEQDIVQFEPDGGEYLLYGRNKDGHEDLLFKVENREQFDILQKKLMNRMIDDGYTDFREKVYQKGVFEKPDFTIPLQTISDTAQIVTKENVVDKDVEQAVQKESEFAKSEPTTAKVASEEPTKSAVEPVSAGNTSTAGKNPAHAEPSLNTVLSVSDDVKGYMLFQHELNEDTGKMERVPLAMGKTPEDIMAIVSYKLDIQDAGELELFLAEADLDIQPLMLYDVNHHSIIQMSEYSKETMQAITDFDEKYSNPAVIEAYLNQPTMAETIRNALADDNLAALTGHRVMEVYNGAFGKDVNAPKFEVKANGDWKKQVHFSDGSAIDFRGEVPKLTTPTLFERLNGKDEPAQQEIRENIKNDLAIWEKGDAAIRLRQISASVEHVLVNDISIKNAQDLQKSLKELGKQVKAQINEVAMNQQKDKFQQEHIQRQTPNLENKQQVAQTLKMAPRGM